MRALPVCNIQEKTAMYVSSLRREAAQVKMRTCFFFPVSIRRPTLRACSLEILRNHPFSRKKRFFIFDTEHHNEQYAAIKLPNRRRKSKTTALLTDNEDHDGDDNDDTVRSLAMTMSTMMCFHIPNSLYRRPMG